MSGIKTINDFSIKGKKLLVRVDINTSIINGKPQISDRIIAHGKTIKVLCSKGAAVVVLAHQGRPKQNDCISLEQHCKLLKRYAKIRFVKDTAGNDAVKAIKNLKKKEAILLENTRFLKEEHGFHFRNKFISNIAPLIDIFVLDAFSVSHRNDTSITGFSKRLPSCMGPVMEKEYENFNIIKEKTKKPFVICLGGLKIHDYFGVMDYYLKNKSVDKILTCGALGELVLIAKGKMLGKKQEFLDKLGLLSLLPKVKSILSKHQESIRSLVDIAVDNEGKRMDLPVWELPVRAMIYDIGGKTASNYSKEIMKAKTVFIKGTPGAYERKGFGLGTKKIFEAAARSNAFTVIGGGDSTSALRIFKIKESKFNYISLSGGALLKYLAGERLPGLEALSKK